jgi:hypothetical protein
MCIHLYAEEEVICPVLAKVGGEGGGRQGAEGSAWAAAGVRAAQRRRPGAPRARRPTPPARPAPHPLQEIGPTAKEHALDVDKSLKLILSGGGSGERERQPRVEGARAAAARGWARQGGTRSGA